MTSVIFGCTCITSWIVWNYIRKKNKKAIVPYKHCRKVYIVETYPQWEDVYTHLMNDLQELKVLGLDCEWVSKNKVALLQLASPAKSCILIRLNKFLSPFPVSFQTLLADKSILKVGVAVVDDAKKLNRDYGLHVKGCVDLRHALKRIRHNFYCPSKGLQGLAKGILGVDIDKNMHIRCGNWEAETFSEEQ
ncbi:Exonuclease 3'-5' domain-containing protein 2, partial [Bulinus truncatus]